MTMMSATTGMPRHNGAPSGAAMTASLTGPLKALIASAMCLGVLAQPSPALAQETYPASPVRLVVGFAAGGPTDLVGRLVAQKLTSQMGMNVLVDNKPGAAGNLEAEFVAKSRPDGYTLLLNSSGVVFSTLPIWAMPALFTSTSSLARSAKAARTDSVFETSTAWIAPVPPAF